MKKLCLFALFFILSVPVLASSISSVYREIEEVVEKKVEEVKKLPRNQCGGDQNPLRVAGFSNYPPFGWMEEIQRQKHYPIERYNFGLAYNILQKIAGEMGMTVSNVGFTSYKEAVEAIDQGRIDLLLGTYYDGNPYSHLDYVYPAYSNNPFVLVSLRDNMIEANSFDDLKGKKVGIRREENIWPLIEGTVPDDVQFVMITGARTAFKKLFNKEVDFLLSSRYAVETEIQRFKIVTFIEISQKPLKEPRLFYAFYKGGDCSRLLKKEFQERLSALVQDPVYMTQAMMDVVNVWKEKFKDEPSMLIKDGLAIHDEMADLYQEEDMDDEVGARKKKLQQMDVNVLINSLTANGNGNGNGAAAASSEPAQEINNSEPDIDMLD